MRGSSTNCGRGDGLNAAREMWNAGRRSELERRFHSCVGGAKRGGDTEDVKSSKRFTQRLQRKRGEKSEKDKEPYRRDVGSTEKNRRAQSRVPVYRREACATMQRAQRKASEILHPLRGFRMTGLL